MNYYLFTIFLSHSMVVIILIYTPIYFVYVFWLAIGWGDFNDADFGEKTLSTVIFAAVGLAFFYVIQKLELKRFYQQ